MCAKPSKNQNNKHYLQFLPKSRTGQKRPSPYTLPLYLKCHVHWQVDVIPCSFCEALCVVWFWLAAVGYALWHHLSLKSANREKNVLAAFVSSVVSVWHFSFSLSRSRPFIIAIGLEFAIAVCGSTWVNWTTWCTTKSQPTDFCCCLFAPVTRPKLWGT